MPATLQPNASTPTDHNPGWFGSIAHTELGSDDPKATMGFLSEVFGMKFEPMPGPVEYNMAYTPGQPSCAVRPAMPQEGGPSQTPYIMVPDIDAVIHCAQGNGANVVLPKTPVGDGSMAWLQIPGGNHIAIMQAPSQ